MHRRSSNLQSLDSRDSGYSVSESDHSNKSYHSYETTPTDYSSSTRPPYVHHETCDGRLENACNSSYTHYDPQYHDFECPRSSIETYASTVDFEDDHVEDDVQGFQLPPARPQQSYLPNALPATPSDFAELFPSSRQLSIKHDDATNDGNMNLRVDTTVGLSDGRLQDITLFHLRMHDLKKREFSLRRYCRDSGREVCHSVRRYQQSTSNSRPSLGRSLSNAFAAMRCSPESKPATSSKLKRSDSGYESIVSRPGIGLDQDSKAINHPSSKRHTPMPTNTTKLEFSNYSQVDVRRRGTRGSKRYEFHYWGTDYTWRRVVCTESSPARLLYHLYRVNDPKVLARIEPWILSKGEAYEERRNGGWIPPCSMTIDDPQILRDGNETSE